MITYTCLFFSELSNDQLYNMLQLRQEVFVVEQNCPYLDCDDKDQESYHVLGIDDEGRIQACTRLVPPGLSYDEYSSIGRVVTSPKIRGKKQGGPLMTASIRKALEFWPEHPIKISAQVYIKKFYNDLGFHDVGEPYLEDNIPHIAMIFKK